MGDINWAEQAKKTPPGSTSQFKLIYYAADGNVAYEGQPASTKTLQYLTADNDVNPAFPDDKNRPKILFEFLEIETNIYKKISYAVGSRFFEAFTKHPIAGGTFCKIKRTGSKKTTNFELEVVDQGGSDIPFTSETPKTTAPTPITVPAGEVPKA